MLIEKLISDIEKSLSSEQTQSQIYDQIFKKSGIIESAFNQVKSSSDSSTQKAQFKAISDIRTQYLDRFKNMFKKKNDLDPTIETNAELGKIHPIAATITAVRNIMNQMGFDEVDGPNIDDAARNFDMLNVDLMHPARGMHDTFYLENGLLLRTHTTNVQIRVLESQTFTEPFSVFTIGSTYRRDDDATHSPVFHQMDWIVVDKNTSVAALQNSVITFIKAFFECNYIRVRFRSNFFPFTCPSLEVDVLAKFDSAGNIGFAQEETEGTKWLEILGSGMIRQNILERYDYTNTQGFAIGVGIERLCMLKYGIGSIPDLYKNRYPFLRKFGIDVKNL